jgi:amidase
MLAFIIHYFGKKLFNTEFDKKKLENWTLGLGRFFRRNLSIAPTILRRLKKFSSRYEHTFSDYDILLSPTLSHAPPKIG